MVPDAPAIALADVTKAYGDHAALAGLDLDVPAGSITGFLGPNGAGKTTTLRLLVGLLRADGGTVRVLGRDPWRDVRVRARLGYLPSDPGFHGHQTGREALDHLAALSGGGAASRAGRAAACEAVALGDGDLAREVRAYSRGMRQKLGIVQALQHDPELAILDEPSEGLDPLVQRGLLALIAGRAARGRTVLFSSHLLAEVEAVCDRVAIVRRGRTVASGTLEELRRSRPRRVAVLLPDAAADLALPGAEVVERDGARAVLRHRGPVAPLLAALAALAPLDVQIEDASLDEVFLDHYGPGAAP